MHGQPSIHQRTGRNRQLQQRTAANSGAVFGPASQVDPHGQLR
jgi:hypothetical protein